MIYKHQIYDLVPEGSISILHLLSYDFLELKALFPWFQEALTQLHSL